MTTSSLGAVPDGAFVWVWLPDASVPVVAGRVQVTGTSELGAVLSFAYGRSYLSRDGAISLFAPELPLQQGTFDPTAPLIPGREPTPIAGCLRDSAPDAWGRRVINLRVGSDPNVELSELTYLLASGSDRIGALDFQTSATEYVPRGGDATLEQLAEAAARAEAGEHIPDDLAVAAGHGTSVGGARPKALLTDGDRNLIAKFSSSTDDRPVVKAEAAAMMLARYAGIDVPEVEVLRVSGKDVLVVERFDRTPGGGRRMLLSALTVLGLGEYSARYASYPMLADAITTSFRHPENALRELFLRLVFNVCIGNNDDHLRNHAAFWDGVALELAPAYDLTPQPRRTSVSNQAIAVTDDGYRSSQLWVCRKAAPAFRLTASDADDTVDHVVSGIREHWKDAAEEAHLTAAERDTLMGREVLNPYIFYDQR
ncbi:serine/threonine-protein kinase HipA [Frankineae bacterium MT45]|nr:serine/threonine-protein kinase HipA [Frankineae bacterium MT45]